MTKRQPVHGTYFGRAFTRTASESAALMRAEIAKHKVRYDTIVGTGLSGTVFIAQVAGPLRKKFAILRKQDDTSTHSSNRLEGCLGKTYIVADDFVSTGQTVKRVIEYMTNNHPECKLVGLYQYETPRFTKTEDLRVRKCINVEDILIGPVQGPVTPETADGSYSHRELTQPRDGWHEDVQRELDAKDQVRREARTRAREQFHKYPSDLEPCKCDYGRCELLFSKSQGRSYTREEVDREWPGWRGRPNPASRPRGLANVGYPALDREAVQGMLRKL